MTSDQARQLMKVVRWRLQRAGIDPAKEPEYDDMLAIAYLEAWRAVEAMPADCPYAWTTIATRSGLIAARHHRERRASGRLGTLQIGTPAYRARHWAGEPLSEYERVAQLAPVPLSSLDPAVWEVVQPTWDGGIAAADARLQLWVLAPDLTPGQREILRLLYREHLTMAEAARQLGIRRNSAECRYEGALKKYRIAAGIDPTWAKNAEP